MHPYTSVQNIFYFPHDKTSNINEFVLSKSRPRKPIARTTTPWKVPEHKSRLLYPQIMEKKVLYNYLLFLIAYRDQLCCHSQQYKHHHKRLMLEDSQLGGLRWEWILRTPGDCTGLVDTFLLPSWRGGWGTRTGSSSERGISFSGARWRGMYPFPEGQILRPKGGADPGGPHRWSGELHTLWEEITNGFKDLLQMRRIDRVKLEP